MLHSPSTVITCHSNADWDAVTAMLGLYRLYPDSVLLFPGSMEVPINTFFTDVVCALYPVTTFKDLEINAVKTVVVADTRQRARIPQVHALLDRGVAVHVWDHHPPTDDSLNVVFERVQILGATCTLVCQELQARGISPNCQEATFLGLGIYSDTGAFTYTSTQPEDYMAAAWLKNHDMDLLYIADAVQHTMTSAHVKLLGALLDSATVHEVGPYSMVMADATMDGFVNDFAYLSQKFMEMEPCSVLFTLGNMDDKIQIVARSRVSAVDVGSICKSLGGGGHKYAASALVKDKSLAELKDTIFQQLFAQVHPYKVARDLMSSPAVGIDDSTSITDAVNIMNRYGLKAAPIFRANTRYCIGFMECQTASKALAHGLGGMPVSDYLQRKVLMAPADAPLQRLMDIIVGAHQRLVPIVENGEVIGVVTRTDLINMFVEEPGRIPLPQPEGRRERDVSRVLNTRLPKPAQAVLRQAGALGDDMGVNVYAVGGFVRDLLLSRPSMNFDDVDLVVEGDGIAFARVLATQLNGRLKEHTTFMTALIIYRDATGKEQRLDVATARLEYYQYPASLPTVELSSIKMDLFRRDFTINAMALRLNRDKYGNLVDFFGGQNDIHRKTIRVIHALSFVEDPTRIIRAIRFEQRYGFHLSVQCEKLIKNALSLQLMDKLSGPRLLHELELIFSESASQTSLNRLNKLGVLAAIHPLLALGPDRAEILFTLREVIHWYRLLYLGEPANDIALHLLALCSGLVPEDADSVYQRLSVHVALKNTLLTTREHVRTTLPRLFVWQRDSGKVSELYTLLAPLSLEGLLYLMTKAHNDEVRPNISQFIYKWRHIVVDITGEDLRGMNLTPGPLYGVIMRRVLAAKLDGFVETREDQLILAHKEADSLLHDRLALPVRAS